MIYRILVLLLIGIININANDKFNNFFQNMKAYDSNMNNKTVLEENLDRNISISKDNKNFFNKIKADTLKNMESSIPWIAKKMTPNDVNKSIIENAFKEPIVVDTIFYLFSTSQNNYALYNFIKEVSKLKKVNHDIQYSGVVQGILSQGDLSELQKPFEYNESLSKEALIRMHPFIYRELNIKKVPAYLFSKCPIEFEFKKCENKFLIRGDISLIEALHQVTKEDDSYIKYLDFLQLGDY